MRRREEKPEKEDDRTARGRQQLIAVAVSLIGSIVVLLLVGVANAGTTVIWTVVFALLSLQMFRGRNWALWIVVGLTILLGSGNAWTAASTFDTEGSAWPINAALVVIYAWCGFILALSRPLQHFMNEQRSTEKRIREERIEEPRDGDP